MSLTFTSPAISNSFLKVKWREQYGSAGINKKLYGIVPSGIYRGLTLGTSGSNNTITVTPDVTNQDHLAVYETADGYSVTLRDDTNATYSLDLAHASLYSQDVVIAVFVEYKEGSSSANFVAYTVAEYNALSAGLRKELLILGTVYNPAAGNVVSSITNVRRTIAQAYPRLVKNGGFEHGAVGSNGRYDISHWENILATNGHLRLSTSSPGSGSKCLVLTATSTSGVAALLEQYVEIPVTAGSSYRVTADAWQVVNSTLGSVSIVLQWGDSDSAELSVLPVAVGLTGAVDTAYRSIDVLLPVPAGAFFLKKISIKVDNSTFSSTGVVFRLDNVQVYLDTSSSKTLPLDDAQLQSIIASSVVIEDPDTVQLDQLAALMRFDKSSPAGEGSAVLGRKDQDYTGGNLPPALAIDGRFMELGKRLLDTEAKALLPRVTADVSVAVGVDFTLMWESPRDGETAGAYTQPIVRTYVSPDGSMVMTSNALWIGTAWTKDLAGQNATRFSVSSDGIRIKTRVADASWSDSSWDDTMKLANPLTSIASANTPRASFGLRTGASSTEVNLITEGSYGTQKIRTYSSFDASNVYIFIVFNAAWSGTNWVRDVSGKAASRIKFVFDALDTTQVGENLRMVMESVSYGTDTFADSKWAETDVGTATRRGIIVAGKVVAGSSAESNLGSASVGLVAITGLKTATEYDATKFITAESFEIDSLGLLAPAGPWIFEEFDSLGVPAKWADGSTGGTITYGADQLSRVTIAGGTISYVKTATQVVALAGAKFNVVMRYNNVTGASFVGYMDAAANADFGFVQDSVTYGDEIIRIVCRTGAGLQVHSTTVDPSGKGIGKMAKMSAYCASALGGAAYVYYRIELGSAGSATGVWSVGAAPVNPTVGRIFRAQTTDGGSITVDRVCMSGQGDS